jgi:DNA-binding MltR family transcriptional regulator
MPDPSPSSNSRPTSHGASYVKDIHGKSDRAVAIVGAAVLNAHLEQLLNAFFVNDQGEIEAMTGNDRPLGNFGNRIRMAYLAGLISKEEHEDLWSINQIDEAFTRDMGGTSFNDTPISIWCLDMRLPNRILLSGEMRTPRRVFVFTTALLLRQLSLRIDMAAAERREPPPPFSLIELEK